MPRLCKAAHGCKTRQDPSASIILAQKLRQCEEREGKKYTHSDSYSWAHGTE